MATLHGDKPIESQDQDVLGLTSFADAVAKSLVDSVPDEGIVLSIEGEWGSGKTSAIELTQRRIVIRELARGSATTLDQVESRDWATNLAEWDATVLTRRTHVIRFNPWNFSGQENLIRAFFLEVGLAIGHPKDGPIGKAINKITDHLANMGTVVGGAIGALSTGGPGVAAGGAIGRATGEALNRVLSDTDSLESAKRELASALKEAKKRIVVIIDDLDRLLPGEMRAMFSLVKSLGDLPHVFYVLSFDKEVVSRALAKGIEAIDPAFLEKVIQVPLRLPPPWKPEIRKLFFDRLNAIIGDTSPADQNRWQEALLRAIDPYIKTPRDVARFNNTFQMIWPNIAGDVDFTDMVILTTLQLFEPDVYQSVFDNIELLAGETFTLDSEKKAASRLEPKSPNNVDAAKYGLIYLFPSLSKEWNLHGRDDLYIKKREQRRICTREYYRNYFLFGRDADRIPREKIELALRSPAPKDDLIALIDRLSSATSRRGVPRVGVLLDQLFELVFVQPLLSKELVVALLELSDGLILREDVVWELFVSDNFQRLETILLLGLTPLDEISRIEKARLISEYDAGLTISARVVGRLAGQHGLYGAKAEYESDRLLPIEASKSAVAAVLSRIQAAASSNIILNMPKSMYLLWAWARWAGNEEVKSWIEHKLVDDDAVLRLAEILPNTSYQSGGDGQKVVRALDTGSCSKLIDLDRLKERLRAIADDPNGRADAKKIREEFLDAEANGQKDDRRLNRV